METTDPIRLWNWSGAGESMVSSAEGGYRNCQYLEEELRCTKKGIGEGAVDASTRSKMSVEMEMEKRRAARPVWSWKQLDKLSTAFLVC